MKPFDGVYDLAIVGSGFGGSLLAMVARRLGFLVLLLEKGRHPRFAIGESTSPLANLLLEELACRYDLPRLTPLASYGSWQRAYPNLRCGLKRGFSFFGHAENQTYRAGENRQNQLLVAASPNDETADTHWLRADVDEFLMREAVAAGAEYWDDVTLTDWKWDGAAATLIGTRDGEDFSSRARLTIDAGGPRGFLARVLEIGEEPFENFPATQALYSHFDGVKFCAEMPEFRDEFQTGELPYPPDAAAVHHVFDGGWMWILRFDDGIVSAGIAVTEKLAFELNLADGAAAWQRFLTRFPTMAAQFAEARAIRPFVHAPRLAYRAARASGAGWAMLPSAAAFIDPLFSTGIPLTLLGIQRLGAILTEAWNQPNLEARLSAYAETTLAEAETAADLIGGCYAGMSSFPAFSSLSQFYFAAASFSEMARRLEKPHLARRFLASDHPRFSASVRRCTASLRSGSVPNDAQFAAQVRESISCLNIAGLCDAEKRNWYGVDLEDVIKNADKLEMTPEQMRAVLRDAVWAQQTGK